MAKIVLTQEQLQALRNYISRRSMRFQDPVILQEILDHFACKVEELMEQNPRLDFEDALQKAHRSFGVRGFAPIADHVEQSLIKRYKQYSNIEMKAVSRSFHMVGILASGVLTYLLLKLCRSLLNSDIAFILVVNIPMLIYTVTLGLYRHHRVRSLKAYKMVMAAAYQASPVALLFRSVMGFWVFEPIAVGGYDVSFVTCYIPVMMIVCVFSMIVQSRLVDRAIAEAEDNDRQQSIIA